MKTKTIYLLRHGETDFNKNGMVQGRGVNASLNEKGQAQAKRAAQKFQQMTIDSFYTSSLIRTHETIAPISTNYLELDGFDEISWGDQEGVKTTPEAKNMYASTLSAWKQGDLNLNVGGGESPIQVMDRQKEALNVVMNDGHRHSLVCMHGRAMRILLCWMLNYPLNYMDGFPHQNCCYYALDFNGSSFSIKEFNQVAHLID